MAVIDVCNGDADGLFALHQLRLAEPVPATILTGLKHEIELLARVDPRPGDRITVLDLSLDRNRAALERALAAGAKVRWFDHHVAGRIPTHPNFEAHIDCAADVCTSILVDRHLGGRFRAWAAAAAYGDNLHRPAARLAASLGLAPAQGDALRLVGEAVNYNAYGETAADVLIAPAELYARLAPYRDPFDLLAHEPLIGELDTRRRADLQRGLATAPQWEDSRAQLVVLPDADWSRRVLGPLANALALGDAGRAHAVARARPDGSFTVSVRAPIERPRGADALCRRFGGGGRRAAGAIERVPAAAWADFSAAFAAMRWGADDDPA
jgi:hypothetical protein